MAENKQYITQIQENGSIMISEDVVSDIVAQAVMEVEGIVSLNVKPGADIADKFGVKNWGKGIKVIIAEDNSLTVSCNVTVAYGNSVVTVAQNAQQAIASALESMTAVTVATVNVNVCGIVRQ